MFKKILKETQSYIIELPESTSVYVFGSSLYAKDFNDIDLFFVIPDAANKVLSYEAIRKFCKHLEESMGSVVDFTILTNSEEQEIKFAEQVQALLVYP
jgi:predicted nucleotidyltransferase